eukprot:6202812-Pleurochrysis_carterae.AAC.2
MPALTSTIASVDGVTAETIANYVFQSAVLCYCRCPILYDPDNDNREPGTHPCGRVSDTSHSYAVLAVVL